MSDEHTLEPFSTQLTLPDNQELSDAHKSFQEELERIGSDSLAAQLRASDLTETGMTVYADEYIDCLVASDGLLDRVGRRAGLHPVAQRALLTHYYEIVKDKSTNFPTSEAPRGQAPRLLLIPTGYLN